MPAIHSDNIRHALKLYFIMGSINCKANPLHVLSEAIAGGITIFQFREKGPTALIGQAKFELAKQLQTLCQAHRIPFIVNDDIDLAIAIGADGIHVGQDDEPVSSLRKRLGPHAIIGVSAHTLEEAQQAIQDGANYLGVGPIYPTKSKDDAKESQGTRLIEQLRAQGILIPLVGIGGITLDKAACILHAGVDGVSVISAIAQADSVRDVTTQFIREIEMNQLNVID
ncbi:thiamine phosphate synthase [Paenibacillus crassostreae]|uniref:Thiamine-phosphate synthase n=1 Tax=Paenibacillus crassostreae TaxID=1763538 RepID=A0A167G3H8_9BACL|nr:thiamine phosphate synthase [Paenibacillus crassostreae]AOZ93793.1 thiamine-phosphate diphosphorylase [Paenibacillus crassostreae]OAB77173.1 thiamine-phosphate diphosphorylase [Paenibacillus crassostreae]